MSIIPHIETHTTYPTHIDYEWTCGGITRWTDDGRIIEVFEDGSIGEVFRENERAAGPMRDAISDYEEATHAFFDESIA